MSSLLESSKSEFDEDLETNSKMPKTKPYKSSSEKTLNDKVDCVPTKFNSEGYYLYWLSEMKAYFDVFPQMTFEQKLNFMKVAAVYVSLLLKN